MFSPFFPFNFSIDNDDSFVSVSFQVAYRRLVSKD